MARISTWRCSIGIPWALVAIYPQGLGLRSLGDSTDGDVSLRDDACKWLRAEAAA